jgi:branched-chain amino acid transport system substrate-binding protein
MGTPVIRKLLFTLCTLALTLTAEAYAAEPIKVGTTQSLTGHYKDFGTEQLRGLQMWVADINARGALLGRPVELVHYDDGSRKVRSVEGYTRLIEQDKVDLLVGPYSSALTLEASAATEKYNIPMVASAASADEIWSRGLKNIFGIDTPSSRYLDLDTNVMALLDAKTMAVVYAQTPFAEDVIAGMRTNAAEDGVRIVLEESYPPDQLEFSDLATRLAQIDADVILGISYLNDSVALVRALKQANVKPKLLAFTVGPALKEFGDALGEDAEGVAGIVQWLRSIPLPGAQDFAYRYRKRYGENPGVHAVIGYSAGQVIETAVRLAGTTDKDAVREQLRTMYFRSLLGKYNVDETGRQEGKRNVMLQWQDNRRRLVAPANLAERKPIYPLP